LTRNEVGNAAMQTLASFGDRVAGQLGDALLDREHYSTAARRRLARVLSQGSTARAAASLLQGLEDPDFQVRAQIAQALFALKTRGVRLRVDIEVWLSAARSELLNQDPVPLAERLDCVFSLLKLAYDSDALELARRAMSGPNAKLRGTALEYLENVLPVGLRSALFDVLNTERPAVSRPENELLDEMKQTLA
jgi:HEAT repeat protein